MIIITIIYPMGIQKKNLSLCDSRKPKGSLKNVSQFGSAVYPAVANIYWAKSLVIFIDDNDNNYYNDNNDNSIYY